MVPSAIAFTAAPESSISIFLEPGPSVPPPTRPVLRRNTSKRHESMSSCRRLACCSSRYGKKGFVPGTRNALPSSALPPAEVPWVSPSMKKAAACSLLSRATAGMMLSLRLRIRSCVTAPTSRGSRQMPSEDMGNVARPFLVYEVSKKSTGPPSTCCDTFSR